MQWIREYIAKEPSLRTFETHISTIENNVEINPSLHVVFITIEQPKLIRNIRV